MPRIASLPKSALLVAALALAGCAASGRSLELVSGGTVVYPAEARAAGTEGFVVVRYDIDAQGRVINPTVVEAQPAGVFEAAAIETVSSWRFRPARRGSQPQVIEGVQSRVEFSVRAAEAYRDY
jgi:TonB family protein